MATALYANKVVSEAAARTHNYYKELAIKLSSTDQIEKPNYFFDICERRDRLEKIMVLAETAISDITLNEDDVSLIFRPI